MLEQVEWDVTLDCSRGIKAAGRRASTGRPNGTAIGVVVVLRSKMSRQWRG